MSDQSSRKPPPARPAGRPTAKDTDKPGRVAEDDRGNMAWQWANDAELQADDTAGGFDRLQALVDPALVVVEDDAPNSLKHNAKGLKAGYNPYDSGALGKTERKKKKSLRELSKWIETKRRVAEKKAGDE
jgi:hypothetical protein